MDPRWPDLVELATRYLRELIRFDTTNPPGAEAPAAYRLLTNLQREGIWGEVYESGFGRGNMIARLPAEPPAPRRRSLLLVSHLDVAPAEPDRWQRPPFSGDLAEGAVWGRGAVDAKGPLAVFAALLVGMKRLQVPLQRDLVLVAAADGEMGGGLGLRWLLKRLPDQLVASGAITGGGGWPFRIHGKTHFTCVNSQKGLAVIRLSAHSTPGHGGYQLRSNTLVLLARALAALHDWDPPVHVTPGFQQLVETVASTQEAPASRRTRSMLNPLLTAAAIRRLVPDPCEQAALLTMCRNSFCPTVLRGGDTPGSVPASAEAVLDCRLLPGQTGQTACSEVEGRLRDRGLPVGRSNEAHVRVDVIREAPSTESPPNTELTRCLERAIGRHRQSAGLVPAVAGWANDASILRSAGTLAYGFFPMPSAAPLATVHSNDERLDLESLEFALRMLWGAVARYAARNEA